MCFLDTNERAEVERVLHGLVSRRKKFTGYEVYKIVRKQFPICSHLEVSAYVREMFNQGRAPMLGYGAMNVTPSGPVLYFMPHSHVAKWAARIRDNLFQR